MNLSERFWTKVNKQGYNGCWLWTASVDKSGYGQIGGVGSVGNRTMLKAHRVGWELTNGRVNDGLLVLHHCDIRRCVNPEHLFLGTNQDNVDDMNRKGRNRFQRENPSTKLTDVQVIDIRNRRKNGERLAVIAAEFGVTQGTVSRIVTGARRGAVR